MTFQTDLASAVTKHTISVWEIVINLRFHFTLFKIITGNTLSHSDSCALMLGVKEYPTLKANSFLTQRHKTSALNPTGKGHH